MRLMRCSELTVSPGTSRATRRAILRSALLSVLAPLGVEHAAQGWIAHAGDVAYAAAADQHNAVFLEVVAFAGDVGDDFALVGQADLRNLAERRVRLFRGRRVDTGANAALLRVCVHRRDLGLHLLGSPDIAEQQVDRGHGGFTFTFTPIKANGSST